MNLIKYVIECDSALVINKEYTAKEFPLCLEWFAGNDLILEPGDFQKIKINENIFLLRKSIPKKGKTDIVPFLFLESVRRSDFDRARRYLDFQINDQQLREYFGEFEIIVNNYLCRDDVFSILPKGADTARSFVFEITNGKIANISQT